MSSRDTLCNVFLLLTNFASVKPVLYFPYCDKCTVRVQHFSLQYNYFFSLIILLFFIDVCSQRLIFQGSLLVVTVAMFIGLGNVFTVTRNNFFLFKIN